MSEKTPSHLTLWQKIHLTYLAIVDPSEFEARERTDGSATQNAPNVEIPRVRKIRKAYGESIVLVVSAVVFGCLMAPVCNLMIGHPNFLVTGLGVAGATILLWATVAVRGWDVASFSLVTLGERLNAWIFRTLYWMGTMLLIWSGVWSILPV